MLRVAMNTCAPSARLETTYYRKHASTLAPASAHAPARPCCSLFRLRRPGRQPRRGLIVQFDRGRADARHGGQHVGAWGDDRHGIHLGRRLRVGGRQHVGEHGSWGGAVLPDHRGSAGGVLAAYVLANRRWLRTVRRRAHAGRIWTVRNLLSRGLRLHLHGALYLHHLSHEVLSRRPGQQAVRGIDAATSLTGERRALAIGKAARRAAMLTCVPPSNSRGRSVTQGSREWDSRQIQRPNYAMVRQ
jgi:hypothetical protein